MTRPPETGPTKSEWQLPRWVGVAAWVLFLGIWLALAILYVAAPDLLTRFTQWVTDQSLVAEVAIWILLLPVMVGLTVWESSWDLWIRILGVAGCVAWTTVGFYPDRISGRGK